MNKSDLSTILTKLINYLMLFLFAFLFLSIIFINNSSTFSYKIIPQIASFLIILSVFLFVPFFICKNTSIKKYFKYNYKKVILFFIILLAFFQLYIILTSATPIGWDCGILVSGATTTNLSESQYYTAYFSTYPNNLFLLFIFRIISTLIGSTGLWFKLDLLCLISIDISLILVFYITKKIHTLKSAYITFFISALTFGIFAWIIVPYSDVLAMPFTIGTYALYLKYSEIKENNDTINIKKYIFALLIGLFIFTGYLIKPTVVITFLGIILTKIIFNLNKSFFKNNKPNKINLLNKIIPFILIITTILCSNLVWTKFIYSQKIIHLNKDLKVPMSHFAMMGLNTNNDMYGAWYDKDVNLTLSQPNIEEKTAVNKKVIKERLKNFGIPGYADFLLNKARWITSEGNFFFGGEGNFAKFDTAKKSSLMPNIIYTTGKYNKHYQYFIQGIWISILFLILVSSIANLNHTNYHYFSFSIIILGIILFILLFEGRSRYLILYLPFFTMYASKGITYLTDSFSKLKEAVK